MSEVFLKEVQNKAQFAIFSPNSQAHNEASGSF